MKSVWIKADEGPWEERKPIITFALESGADCVLVSEADVDAVKRSEEHTSELQSRL